MDKQEFQQKIKDMKPPKFFTAITLGEAYEAGFEEAKGNALYNSCFLNEPEKPVVPPYIDTWIQGCKYNGFDLLEAMTMSIDIPEKTSRWISDNPETFAKAWLYDYDVEKEKLYTVEIPSNNETHHFVLRKYVDGEVCIDYYLSFDWRDYKCVQLTEAEIKKDFDWAWKFAEEVEVLDEK